MRDQLIGREEQLARADAFLRAEDGTSARLAFSGAPGAGKTALLRATARLAEQRGYHVVWAQAHHTERDFPFGVARQLFEPSLAAGDERDRRELTGGKAAAAARLLSPDDLDGGDAAGDAPGEQLIPALCELAARLAARRPLLLAVDDVHWADAASLDWLIHLVCRRPVARVRMVMARSPGVGAPAARELAGGAAAVPIPALGEHDIATLARDLLGTAAVSSLARDCRRATNGNALLVAETLRAAAAASSDDPAAADAPAEGGRRQGGDVPPARVPCRITRWVSSWLGRLAAGAPALARAIVILGEHAEISVAAKLAGLDADEADTVAAALARAGFLAGGDRPRFGQPLVRDAVDQLIPPGARRLAHATAATLLHEAGGPPEVVAAHLMATDPLGRRWAAETLRRAAAGAPRGSAGAVGHLRRALREPVDSALRAELLAELGRAELFAKVAPDRRTGLHAAVEHLSEALDIVRDVPLLARVAADLATAHYLDGEPDQAMRVVDRAVAGLAGGHQGVVDRLDALALAMTAPGDGAPHAEAHAERLDRLRVAAARDSDLAVTVAAFGAGRAAVAGRADEAVAQARRVAEAGPPRTPRRLLDYSTAAGVLCCADGLDLAAHCGAAVIAQADEAGPAGFAALGHALAARIAFHEGRLDDAIDEARIAAAVQFAVNGRAHACARSWELAALLVKGDQNASAAILTDAGLLGERRAMVPGRARGADQDAAFLDAHFLGARGLLREMRGDLECALVDHLDCGRRLTAAGIVNPAMIPWRSRAALVSHRLGRREAALRLASEELGLATRWGTPRAIGVALHALGLVAGGPDGLSLLEESVASLARSPARVEHAHALYELGRALGEVGRQAEARPLLHESYRVAGGCGARPLADRCAAEIKRVGGRRPRALLAGTAALTAQERRIAERAVAGATNREIAEELFLTLRTVEAHLTGVYRKLGISGRAQLAAHLMD
jgi:DNA-binding CsgD family transcriptional regulator